VVGWENHVWSYEQKSVAATIACQLDDLEQHRSDTSNLLQLLSYFDPENIPTDMIVVGAESLSLLQAPSNVISSASATTTPTLENLLLEATVQPREPMSSPKSKMLLALIRSPIKFQDAIMQLQNRSLIKHLRNADTSTLRIHDLTRMMVQEGSSKSDDEHEWFELAVAMACGAFSRRVENPELPKCWSHCKMFIPHFQQLARWDKMYSSWNTRLTEANMNIVRYLHSCGRYNDAETLCQQVLTVRKDQLGMQHPNTLTTLRHLANLYEFQGRYNDAQALCERILALWEKIGGTEHPEMLAVKHVLACAYRSQGRYRDAETLFKQVLVVREKVLGEEHPDTLDTMDKIADVYEYQGHYSDAETLYKQVLVVREKVLGEEHPDTLDTMHSIADIYEAQERYSDAETLFKQVLVVREKVLGEEHPDTLTTMHSIADIYESQGRYSDAETLYKQVLVVSEKVLGEEHPDTLDTMHNIADVYEAQGRYSDAETLYKQVLAVSEKVLGEEHPDTLFTMHNIAGVYESQGRYSDAETLYKRVLVVRENVLGVEHPYTLITIESLADLYESLERHADAETLRSRALTVGENESGRCSQTRSRNLDNSGTSIIIRGMSYILFNVLRTYCLESALLFQTFHQQMWPETVESPALP
jgi:tetratricopeptide (TPR) repeat protein